MPKQKDTPKQLGKKQVPNTNQSSSPKKVKIDTYNKPLNDMQTVFLMNKFRDKIQSTQTYNRMGGTQKSILLEAVRFYVNSQMIKYSTREADGVKFLQFYFPFQIPGINMDITYMVEVREDKFNEL